LPFGRYWPAKFRIGDIGVRGTRRDRCQIALAEDRRHRLARAAHLRTDRGDDLFVGNHLSRVCSGLRRIVLARRGSAVVEQHHRDFIAGNPALFVGFVDGKQRTVLDEFGIVRVGPSKGQVYANLDCFVGGISYSRSLCQSPDQSGSRKGDKQRAT
jgi:hypothetical protein